MSKTNGMKKALKFILPLLAVIITVAGVWAMRNTHRVSQKGDTYYYYKYIPTQASLSLYKNSTNWVQTTTPDEESCEGTAIPCIVQSTQSTVSSFVNSISTKADVESAVYAQKDGTEVPEQ